jgi:signal peptidase I
VVAAAAALAALHVPHYRWFEVTTGSMEPTIEPGTLVFVDTSSEASAGRVVAVEASIDGVEMVLVKRAVAVGREEGTVVEGRSGRVWVDGTALDEPYLKEGAVTRSFPPVRLDPGDVFLLGDNRGNSRDSIDDGPRPGSAVIGTVAFSADPWPSSL